MKKLMATFTVITLIAVGSLTVWADEETADQTPKKSQEKKTVEADGPTMICEELKEKIDIFRPLQETVSQDFARLSDQKLCNSMSSQCEYFYSKIKEYDKAYKDQCNADYAMPKVEKCDYDANPCNRVVKSTSLRARTAGL